MELKIACFKDKKFSAPPEYNSKDIEKLLTNKGIRFLYFNNDDLEEISRSDIDILLIPYISGNFSKKALLSLVKFHTQGGSLLFLGDLPHKDKSYPARNIQGYLFHLTHQRDFFKIDTNSKYGGLTEKGAEIVGELEDIKFFKGRKICGLRITAYPPDKTYPLLYIKSDNHTQVSSSIIAVERRCEKFLGAKLAVIGYDGGEPRENIDGAYQREWVYDPGLLTRRWKGINNIVFKLIEWLKPNDIGAGLSFIPVTQEGIKNDINIILKNINKSGNDLYINNLKLYKNNKIVYTDKDILIKDLKKIKIQNISKYGIMEYLLKVNYGDKEIKIKEEAYGYPEKSSIKKGFGFSTYFSFRDKKVNNEYKFFVLEMMKRGCQYVRVNIPWEDIEPAPKKYDWTIPDEILEFAEKNNIFIQFWMFPTTRGSGLSDGGVPWWVLKEPAIDRYGNKGFFPSLWSPYYRQYYFNMIDKFTKRYAKSDNLIKFVIDFGNSDFPYGYYYYYNDTSLFDYSSYEQLAFARYLEKEIELDLATINKIYKTNFKNYKEIPVPFIEQKEAYRYYLDFRRWSISVGIQEVHNIVKKNAPDKLSSDYPGHGLGSIADIGSYIVETKAKHWLEEQKFDKKYTYLHNSGKEWGGEAWQVGGDYRQYDDSLFQSLRLNSTYYTIPGPDLGVYGEDIAKIGFIRRTIMGAKRSQPELAVFAPTIWNDYYSLANIATRLDFPIDIISSRTRYDFSVYKLLVLPAKDYLNRTVTGGGEGAFMPRDEYWYWLLRESVEKGLVILIFPHTAEKIQHLRKIFNLTDINYIEKKIRKVKFPKSFGGGILTGLVYEVIGAGKVLVTDIDNKPILIQRKIGKGAVLIAGFEPVKDSLDKKYNYETVEYIKEHTLLKVCKYMGIKSKEYNTGNLFIFKEMLHKNNDDYFLLFSHLNKVVKGTIKIKLKQNKKQAIDLATGESFNLYPIKNRWYKLNVECYPRKGRYLVFK